jgi:hypothetical protein
MPCGGKPRSGGRGGTASSTATSSCRPALAGEYKMLCQHNLLTAVHVILLWHFCALMTSCASSSPLQDSTAATGPPHTPFGSKVVHSPNLHHCRSTAAVDAAEAAEAGGVLPGEDEDVAAERRLVQSGALRYTTPCCSVALATSHCKVSTVL